MRCTLYIIGTKAYHRPAVGMHGVGHAVDTMRQVAIRLIETALLELLNYNLFLNRYTLLIQVQPEQASRLKPQCSLKILGRQRLVVVGHVGTRPGIALAPGSLQGPVKVGSIARTCEHEVLHEMGQTGARLVLVTTAHVVKQVDTHHARRAIVMMQQGEAVGQLIDVDVDHSTIVAFMIFTSCLGRLAALVSTCWIRSTTSMPSITSPKTVYCASR